MDLLLFVTENAFLHAGQTPHSPPRSSLRLLAKQLYMEEIKHNVESAEQTESKQMQRTPRRSSSDTAELAHTAVRGHNRQLGDTESVAETESVRSPGRKTPLRKSLLPQETTEQLRRSPRLMTRHDNLLLESPAATKANVGLIFVMS